MDESNVIEGYGSREISIPKFDCEIKQFDDKFCDTQVLHIDNARRFFAAKHCEPNGISELDLDQRFEFFTRKVEELKADVEERGPEKQDLLEKVKLLYSELEALEPKRKEISRPMSLDVAAVHQKLNKLNLIPADDIKLGNIANSNAKRGPGDFVSINLEQNQAVTEEFERRITLLENTIGLDSLDPASSIIERGNSSLFATSGSLISQLERIENQLAFLTDPNQFENMMRRVRTCTPALEKLADLKRRLKIDKTIPKNDQDDERISYLYQQMIKLENVSSLLPQLVTRLHGLSELHQESLQFSEDINYIQEKQKSLFDTAKETAQGIEKLKALIIENQAQLIKNLNTLKR